MSSDRGEVRSDCVELNAWIYVDVMGKGSRGAQSCENGHMGLDFSAEGLDGKSLTQHFGGQMEENKGNRSYKSVGKMEEEEMECCGLLSEHNTQPHLFSSLENFVL